jgi:hypothetical protein
VSNAKTVTLDSGFEAALEQVLRGDGVGDTEIEQGELHAARFLANAVPDLSPTTAMRERALGAVRERMAITSHARAWWRPGPIELPAPPLWAAPIAILVLIGVLVGGAYALPVLPQIFGMIDPSGVDILQSGRAQELHLTQTAVGVTITADRAYADAHRIVVQFTVQNPPPDPGQPLNQGQRVKWPLSTGGSVTLTDSAGHSYPHGRAVESPLISGAGWNGEPLVGVYNFDASQIPANAERISFQLTIAELRGVRGPDGAVMHLPGPWIFNFELPVSR